jgi:gliding motility-associated-like protein
MKAFTTSRFQVIILLIFVPVILSAQGKEAYNWYFGNRVGIAYHTGEAVAVDTSAIFCHQTSASVSDSAGNLLFYSNSESVWNRNHAIMPNGDSLYGWSGRQNTVVAIPAPGRAMIYYLFTSKYSDNLNSVNDCRYSLIDMNADAGLGDVIEKNIPLPGATFRTGSNINACLHVNNKDFWIVVRKLHNQDPDPDTLKAYLVDDQGLHPNPVKTPIDSHSHGISKFSADGKYFCVGPEGSQLAEIYNFNKANGTFSLVVQFDVTNSAYSDLMQGIEFSANSEFLYCTVSRSTFWTSDTTWNYIKQYDMSKITSQHEFEASAVTLITTIMTHPHTVIYELLQLAPDGKIVIGTVASHYLGVINYPYIKGLGCDVNLEAISLAPRMNIGSLPNFVQSYFMKFSWKGNCLGDSTKFESWFLPEPDSITWDFGDPTSGSLNFSNLINPLHLFSSFGTYTVHAVAYFSNGAIQEYSRDVLITTYPTFELGPDKYICKGEEVMIKSNAMLVYYNWSTGETTSQITVGESGKYWLEVENNNACKASDTIQVIQYAPPMLIDSLSIISPTTCGNSTGAIKNLKLQGGDPPVTVKWIDQFGNMISDQLDINGLSVRKYYLTVDYGQGCMDTLANYMIVNYDSDLIIKDVNKKDARCGQSNGSIEIEVIEGLSDMLLYSINGVDYSNNEGVFEAIPPDKYIVMVKDSEGCEAVYDNNPVTVINISGPVITSVDITDETTGLSNGKIKVNASGSNLTYYLNGILQSGNFIEGLSAGSYAITVEDEFGCVADTTVDVLPIEGNYLYAIAGNDRKCLNAPANSNIRVSHVSGLKVLRATLNYDGTSVKCTHFNDSLPGITGIVYPQLAQIVLEWQGTTPITTNDTISLGELIFETLESGSADVNWQLAPGTFFTDVNGDTIHPDFSPGIIEVHQVPLIDLNAPEKICENDSIYLLPVIQGGTYPLKWHWNTPQGIITTSTINIPNASIGDSGSYSFYVSDNFNCADTTQVDINIVPLPVVNFSYDTIPFEHTYLLEAIPGYASYEWSNGDTTYYINITEEGQYSVIVQTEDNCKLSDTVMMVNVNVPIFVPNAFTPNGDGLNDTFKPLVNVELVNQFSMSIYNKWGQRIFETSQLNDSWDGKNAFNGVYQWVIEYQNMLGKVYKMRGLVHLIK